MSILPLIRVTIYGLLREKEKVLSDMQEMGCLHLIPGKTSGESSTGPAVSPDARRALAFLLSCPQRRTQVRSSLGFNEEQVELRALELEHMLHSLRNEKDHLQDRLHNLKPWGEFRLPPIEEIKNQKLWFYLVPHHLMNKVEATGLTWAMVNKDSHFVYVVVISEEEPGGMPVARTLTGTRPISELTQRLIEVDNEIEDLESERFSLTRWCTLFAQNLNSIEDRESLRKALNQTEEDTPLFMLDAWAPRERLRALEEYAERQGVAMDVREPNPDEVPPTLLRNPGPVAGGQDLLTFYMTPNYWLSDPSIIIFFSFILFFAIILADAGYALLLGIFLFLIWRGMGTTDSGKRLRILFTAIVAVAAVWGVMVGSYFGKEPEKGSLLAALKILDLNDYKTMMTLSILMGACHITIANIMVILRKGWSAASLPPLGWISMIGGALLMVGGGLSSATGHLGMGLLVAGALAVLLFSGVGHPPIPRLLEGLEKLTRITNAFGDVMSYLRLFALALASASLAIAFNDLAKQVHEAVIPGMGLILSFFVLVIGHGLNLVLGIMAGVVHGLRLNVIEFLNWSTPEEGYPFRAFAKKEEG